MAFGLLTEETTMKSSASGAMAGAAMILCTLGVSPAPANAAVLLSGCAGGSFADACSLEELVGGGSITINDKLFSNFSLSLFGGRPLDASVIRVDTIDSMLAPGITLVDTGGTMRAEDGDATQNDFSFDVSIIAGNLRMFRNTLAVAVGPVAGSDGPDQSYVSVFETVLTQDLSTVLGNKRVDCDAANAASCAGQTGTDLATFGLVDALSVLGGIDVVSVTDGIAAIDSITLRFEQVPAPASLALLAVGALALRVSRRTRCALA